MLNCNICCRIFLFKSYYFFFHYLIKEKSFKSLFKHQYHAEYFLMYCPCCNSSTEDWWHGRGVYHDRGGWHSAIMDGFDDTEVCHDRGDKCEYKAMLCTYFQHSYHSLIPLITKVLLHIFPVYFSCLLSEQRECIIFDIFLSELQNLFIQ